MEHTIKTLKLGYHFFAEGILLFLALFPFFYYTYHWLPYWTYLFILIGMSVMYSFYSRFTKQVAWYIISAPVMMFIFMTFGFSWLMGGFIAVFLTWRYITMRKDTYFEKELVYLLWTVILVITLVLFYEQNNMIIYLIIQFLVLTIGYIASNALTMDKQSQKVLHLKLWRLLGGLGIIGGLFTFIFYTFGNRLFYTLWDLIIVNMWNFLTKILITIAAIPMYLLQKLNISFPEGGNNVNQSNMTETAPPETKAFDTTQFDTNTTYLIWVIIIAIIGLILLFAVKMIKQKFEPEEDKEIDIHIAHSKADKQVRESFLQRMSSRFLEKPTHPVRKVVYQFERKTKKASKGRLSNETIQEWLARIDVDIDVHVYEKVRYGCEDASEQEITKLKDTLQDWEG